MSVFRIFNHVFKLFHLSRVNFGTVSLSWSVIRRCITGTSSFNEKLCKQIFRKRVWNDGSTSLTDAFSRPTGHVALENITVCNADEASTNLPLIISTLSPPRRHTFCGLSDF